jgi:transcriptional regulator with XRE-family HTH domain
MGGSDEANIEFREKGSRVASPIDVHVGSQVRLRRTLLGMSQAHLAERLGLTFQQLQKYEKGINRIGASRLFQLAQVLGVPVQFFYDNAPIGAASKGGAGEPGSAERSVDSRVLDFLNSWEGIELTKAFVRISDPKVRRSLVEVVRAVAGEENAHARA